VIGDTGIASLVTLLLAVAVPRESGRLWAELEQRAKSDRLSEEELIALLDALKFNVMERKIRACRRFKVDAFVSDAARQAAAAVALVAQDRRSEGGEFGGASGASGCVHRTV
jgi:hypothetical protein